MKQLYLFHGDLGSGKTTAIKHLRGSNRFQDAAVIENELASENIDEDKLGDNIYDISGLCICCSTGNELQDALDKTYQHSEDERVILETTGAANIINVLKKALVDPEFKDKYNIASSIHVVGLQDNLDLEKKRSEILVSDVVILNKKDLVDQETINKYKKQVKSIKNNIEICVTENSQINEETITEDSSLDDYLAEAVAESTDTEHELDRYEVIENMDFSSEEEFRNRINNVLKEFRIARMKGSVNIGGDKRFAEYSSGKLRIEDENLGSDKMVVIGDDNVYEAVQRIQKT